MSAEEAPREPLTPAKRATRAAPDSPPPRPPRALEPDTGHCRSFEVDGEEWLARTAGRGAGGTGSYGLGMIEALHFARASEPTAPLFEALLEAGRLPALYDDELRALLHAARRIVTIEEARSAAEGRGSHSPGEG